MNFSLCRKNKLEPGKAEAAEEASTGCHQMMLQEPTSLANSAWAVCKGCPAPDPVQPY